MIEINNISKSYGNVKAIQDVCLRVKKGELFGLIGPDGAGKTTLFRILTTLLLADAGSASVAGYDVVKDYKQIRQIIGYMPGRFSLYQDLSVEENLNFFANIFKTTIQQNYHLIKDIYQFLEPFKNRPAGKLSGGMKQKLALCCALIHKPVVLFLDEPTTGVDAVSRKEFWEMLSHLKAEGITIFVSTPYMDEAGMCEHVALIQGGKIMGVNTPDEIINNYPLPLYAVKSNKISALVNDLRSWENSRTVFSFGSTVHITVNQQINIPELKLFLENKAHTGVQIVKERPNIEDCFMEMMQTHS